MKLRAALAAQKRTGIPRTIVGLEVDWSDVRVICIAPNFKKYDIHAVQVMGANIELWKYRLFENGTLYLEEVFQQMLTGDEQVFQGAILSALPRRLRHLFMVQSWLLCRLFQHLGYAGRCSFDALVVGEDPREATVRFVECNGRWGGTSTPMHLMKRVFGDFRTIPYRGQGFSDPRLKGKRFTDLLSIFRRHLYDRRTGRGRILLYNPGSVTEHGKFDMVVTGRSYADIGRFVEHTIPNLIGRHVGSGQAAG